MSNSKNVQASPKSSPLQQLCSHFWRRSYSLFFFHRVPSFRGKSNMISPGAPWHLILLKINHKENTGPDRWLMGKVGDSKPDPLSSISGTERWKKNIESPKFSQPSNMHCGVCMRVRTRAYNLNFQRAFHKCSFTFHPKVVCLLKYQPWAGSWSPTITTRQMF